MTTEPEHSLEIERTYDVDAGTPLPDWARLPGVAVVGAPEPRELDAHYLDTADGALGRARVALRRRSGGPDEGWHIKRVTPEGKAESRWPLDDGDREHIVVPAEIESVLAEIAAPPFAPLARIRNSRTAYALLDAGGGLLAEFVDDRVTATDVRRGVETAWREWELELGPAAPADAAARDALFDAADELVRAAGGDVSASGSKLERALGL
ncbi:CYTH domain-containing protein [Microbacterium sp. KSW-18]|uniref:CYTH domain-containing protein n=1 Tax=Microbacterium aquilitoris TaxID=3067307 RepID=A0ABU3GMP3_9MICO|nr:CYTH domain-containing protein [Microbacterium sp. KSW-18]MDT3331650.1 CYTH domain-containing protein [Microbacterium sp. KSW-18]